MKNLILIFSFLCAIHFNAHSKCGGESIQVFPSVETIDVQGLVVIQFYGPSISSIRGSYPMFLQSEHEKIRLIKKRFSTGQFNWSQLVLIAEKELKENVKYQLVIERMPKKKKNRLFNKKYSWTATSDNKVNSSNSLKLDNVGTEIIRYGCGPGVKSYFELSATVDKERYIIAQLVDLESNNEIEYVIIADQNKFSIGHGMCSGPVRFKNAHSYKVRFKDSFTDDNWTDWMPCANPWTEFYNKRNIKINNK